MVSPEEGAASPLGDTIMDWQTQLMTVYLTGCEHYRREPWIPIQRFAPYADLRFTDEEVITLYLFGILQKQREIKTLYTHADRYWREWFPHLPSSTAYGQRLNRVADVFPALLETLSPADAPGTPIRGGRFAPGRAGPAEPALHRQGRPRSSESRVVSEPKTL